MTIIKNTAFLANYPFRVLPESLVAAFTRHASLVGEMLNPTLKLFECYCDVTNAKISFTSLSSAPFRKVVEGFLGSLSDTSLVANQQRSRMHYARNFISILDSMRTEIPEIPEFEQKSIATLQFASVWKAQFDDLNVEAVHYWNGWEIKSAKGKSHFLALANLWNTHGREFAEQFYHQWRLFFEKRLGPGFSEVNKLAEFLVKNKENWPAESFYNPQTIKALFLAFMKEYFLDSYDRGLNLNSQIKTWGRFIANCEEAFIQGNIWATPFGGGLPKPTAKSVPGALTRISARDDGTEVHEKLITEVPLNVTDDEAIEIIFKRINADISTVVAWARAQTKDLHERAKQRKILARKGTPIRDGAGKKTTQELGIENICATFEHYGFPTKKSEFISRYGAGSSSHKTAHLLGIPTAYSLFPAQCLLVAEHPEITQSFLEKLKLFDKNGNISGFIETDTGYQLEGFKDRRGPKLSQQKIPLSPAATETIKQVIEITEPLRNHLKLTGDERWRELFLTCSVGLFTPSSASTPPWNMLVLTKRPNIFKNLEESFADHTPLRGEKLKQFLSRVSLSTLRASCGVAVYLKTKSVQEMSKALGHAQYVPDLLAHYLPDSILGFFQSRWIRIFQRGIICEAMKDSPYLLESANFQTMGELHSFLINHALKYIPDHLQNPDGLLGTPIAARDYTQIYIAINPGILTALISLEMAVNCAQCAQNVSGRARYWADLSKVVTEEINQGHDGLLKQHLAEAKKYCDPSRMERLIYANAA